MINIKLCPYSNLFFCLIEPKKIAIQLLRIEIHELNQLPQRFSEYNSHSRGRGLVNNTGMFQTIKTLN